MSYPILYKGGKGEVSIKKSRFIATSFPVCTVEESVKCIESVRKNYYDARHHCYAYAIGGKNETLRSSDDGEPSGTAGHPILDVICGENVHNVLIVVTRYFGGTLLGTGGLVRAYSTATKEGLRNSIIINKYFGKKVSIVIDYQGFGKLQYIISALGLTEVDARYEDVVYITLLVPSEKLKQLQKNVTEASAGRVGINEIEEVCYGVYEQKIVYLKRESK